MLSRKVLKVKMKKLKNDRGVTLIALIITIIVILIITSVSINNAKNQIGLKEVNDLYTDIDILSSKIANYYFENDNLPILNEKEYFLNKEAFEYFLSRNSINNNMVNKNDSGKYYVIDLSKLPNLTLNYGRDYYEWTSSSVADYKDNSDIYIINEKTHQIYYPRGIQRETEFVITNMVNDVQINKNDIETSIGNEVINHEFCWIQDANVKTITQENNELKVLIETNVVFDYIFPIYKKDTLEFQYSYESLEVNLDNSKFISFSLNENDSAILTSNTITVENNQNTIYLWIKIQDIYGNIIVRKDDPIDIVTSGQVWTMTLDKVHVTDGNIELEVGSPVTGYSVTVGNTAYGDGKWYVLGAQNGKLLITTNENATTMTLSGQNGFTGGIDALNTEAEKYTNSEYAYGQARSINIYDINKVTGYNPSVAQYNSGNNVSQWGNEVIYTKNSGDGKIYYYGTKYPAKAPETIGTNSTQTSFTYWTGKEWKTLLNEESSTKILNTYYTYYPQTCSVTTSNEKKINKSESTYYLLFENQQTCSGSNYALASKSVDNRGYVQYGLRCLYQGEVRAYRLYASNRDCRRYK